MFRQAECNETRALRQQEASLKVNIKSLCAGRCNFSGRNQTRERRTHQFCALFLTVPTANETQRWRLKHVTSLWPSISDPCSHQRGTRSSDAIMKAISTTISATHEAERLAEPQISGDNVKRGEPSCQCGFSDRITFDSLCVSVLA